MFASIEVTARVDIQSTTHPGLPRLMLSDASSPLLRLRAWRRPAPALWEAPMSGDPVRIQGTGRRHGASRSRRLPTKPPRRSRLCGEDHAPKGPQTAALPAAVRPRARA